MFSFSQALPIKHPPQKPPLSLFSDHLSPTIFQKCLPVEQSRFQINNLVVHAFHSVISNANTWKSSVGQVLLRQLTLKYRGFPWWVSAKNSPANEGDMGSIPPCRGATRAWEPQLLSPRVVTTEARTPQSLCPTIRETTVMRSLSTTRERPLFPATRIKPAQQ